MEILTPGIPNAVMNTIAINSNTDYRLSKEPRHTKVNIFITENNRNLSTKTVHKNLFKVDLVVESVVNHILILVNSFLVDLLARKNVVRQEQKNGNVWFIVTWKDFFMFQVLVGKIIRNIDVLVVETF